MRKNSPFLLGALAGTCLTLLVAGPSTEFWMAAAKAAAKRRHLLAAQSARRRVRADPHRLRRKAR